MRNMDAGEVAAAAALLRASAGRKASVRAPPRRRVPAEATRGGVQGGWRPGAAEEAVERELERARRGGVSGGWGPGGGGGFDEGMRWRTA